MANGPILTKLCCFYYLLQSTSPAEEVKVDITEAQLEAESAESSISEPQPLDTEARPRRREPVTKAAGHPKNKKCLKRWEKYLVMAHFTMAITLTGAPGSGKDFFPDPFIYELFILVVMLGCFSSIAGIVVSCASCLPSEPFHLAAFLCALLSQVLLFDAALPEVLRSIPWIFTAFLVPTCLIGQ